MADIRCPVCGRSNPLDQKTCLYCGTSLAPGEASASENARGDLPEWLKDFRIEEGQDLPESGEEAEQSGQPFAGDSEGQVWLERIEGRPGSGEPIPDLSSVPEAGEEGPESIPTRADEPQAEVPDWISAPGEEIAPAPEEPSALPAEQGRPSEPLPDWMLEETGGAEEEFELEPPPAEAGKLPEWLQSYRQGEAQPAESPEPPAETTLPTEPQAEAVLPETAEEALAAQEEQVVAEKPLSTDEVSAFLSSEPQVEGEPPAAEEAEEPLAAAELPEWLQAMRPVEGLPAPVPPAPQPFEQPESAGPLAGLRRVLSAEPDAARVQKAAAYPAKLQVTDSQQAHIDQLKQLAETEGEAKPPVFRRAISSQHFLRIMIAVLLILAVLWPLLNDSQSAPLPVFSPETEDFNRIIEQLPEQARVLVSFDYEPSVAGELDATASTVIDHLMLKGAYLTLVSTTPVGPLMGERLIRGTLASHNYAAGEQYINLGYIPGGTTGLTSFAASPQHTMPVRLDPVTQVVRWAWERPDNAVTPPLEGIHSLADFALVLVITENPDTARAWIEQVQPHLSDESGQTPLLVVASAQAEPLVRPYYAATPKQVQGMVVGLQGGAAYALRTGRGGLPRLYWDAFGMGLAVAVGLILIGSLISLVISGWSSAEKNQTAKWSRSPGQPAEPARRKGKA